VPSTVPPCSDKLARVWIKDIASEHGESVEGPRRPLLHLAVRDAERRVTERVPIGEFSTVMEGFTLGGMGSGAVVEILAEPRPVVLATIKGRGNHQYLFPLEEGFSVLHEREDGTEDSRPITLQGARIDEEPFGYRGLRLALDAPSVTSSAFTAESPEPAYTLARRNGPVAGLDRAWLPALLRIDEIGEDGEDRYALVRLFEVTRPLEPSPRDLAALLDVWLAHRLLSELDRELQSGAAPIDRPVHRRVALATDPATFAAAFVEAWSHASPEDPGASAALGELDARLRCAHERTDPGGERLLSQIARHAGDDRWRRLKEALGLPAARPPPSLVFARALLAQGGPIDGSSDAFDALLYLALRGTWPVLLPGGDLLLLATPQAEFAPCREHMAPAWLGRFPAAAEIFPVSVAATDAARPAPRVDAAALQRPGEPEVAAILSTVRVMRFERIPVEARGRAWHRQWDASRIVTSPTELWRVLEEAWSGLGDAGLRWLVSLNDNFEAVLRGGVSPEDEARIQEAIQPVVASPRYARFAEALCPCAPRELPLATTVRAAVMRARLGAPPSLFSTLVESWSEGLWPLPSPRGLLFVDAEATDPLPARPSSLHFPEAARLPAIAPLLIVAA
jgi:hypothetical protein